MDSEHQSNFGEVVSELSHFASKHHLPFIIDDSAACGPGKSSEAIDPGHA